MADSKLSAKEAALIAQARAELGRTPVAGARAPAAAPVRRVEPRPAAVALPPVAPEVIKQVAPSLDPAERVAALMAAARAETEHRRRRLRKLYLWAPVAVIALTAMWALFWMLFRL